MTGWLSNWMTFSTPHITPRHNTLQKTGVDISSWWSTFRTWPRDLARMGQQEALRPCKNGSAGRLETRRVCGSSSTSVLNQCVDHHGFQDRFFLVVHHTDDHTCFLWSSRFMVIYTYPTYLEILKYDRCGFYYDTKRGVTSVSSMKTSKHFLDHNKQQRKSRQHPR
jgi:hypothetical protein